MSLPLERKLESPKFQLCRQRRKVWLISGVVFAFSVVGLISSWFSPEIKAPLRPGLDFTGGTQIKLERICQPNCTELKQSVVEKFLFDFSSSRSNDQTFPNLARGRVQIIDDSQSLTLRLPFLSAVQGQEVIESIKQVAGPFVSGAQSVQIIGPSLGGQLLKSSLISLFVAFAGITAYISFRYDRSYAFLALLALAHDVIIVCGIFAWLGLIFSIEVDSLFAVALLTIAGYSVNDTVVIFDRIREVTREKASLSLSSQIDTAVEATFTRTLYTSGTTLLPLIALILFGGASLYWFSIALAIGVLVGSWSSIALAPSLLSLKGKIYSTRKEEIGLDDYIDDRTDDNSL